MEVCPLSLLCLKYKIIRLAFIFSFQNVPGWLHISETNRLNESKNVSVGTQSHQARSIDYFRNLIRVKYSHVNFHLCIKTKAKFCRPNRPALMPAGSVSIKLSIVDFDSRLRRMFGFAFRPL